MSSGALLPIDARREPLGKNAFVYVTPRHSFNTDTLLLAHFSMPKPRERCADLGTGCGAIPLWWVSRGAKGPIQALELQEEACRLAETSVKENGFSSLISVQQGDLRQPKENGLRDLDVIACNPPYQAAGTGVMSETVSDQTARHETTCTLEDVARTAKAALRWGGRLCLCHRPHRLTDAISILRAFSLEPKRLQLVQQRGGKEPFLFLLEGRRGGKPGIRLLPTLILQENGQDTPALEEIFGDYRQNRERKTKA